MTIDILNSIEIPHSLGIRRDRTVPEEFLTSGFDDEYDFRTLFYDAFFIPRSRAICLVCPKLLNLGEVIHSGKLTSEGQVLKPRLMRRRGRDDEMRYDEIWLRCSGIPDRLGFRFGSFDCSVPVAIQNKDFFKGLRCAVVKSKDNDLAWIKDWAEYHVKVHGLQGLVFFDNGSKNYSTNDVHTALHGVRGLERIRVLSAPFPFGPHVQQSPFRFSSRFLQVGLLNIARLRYFESAASVLVSDIDELVAPTPEGSVFASVERSLFGYVSFRGRWRYPVAMPERNIRHVDHVYGSNDDLCKFTKYCLRPKGLLRFRYWDVHVPRGGSFLERIRSKKFPGTNQICYWHCRKITTNWKYARELPTSNRLHLDSQTKQVLDQVFGSTLSKPNDEENVPRDNRTKSPF